MLHANGRLGNADHLAGFAVECAMKEILVELLGAPKNKKGQPYQVVNGKDKPHGHLPELWHEVSSILSGRAANTALSRTLMTRNPFSSWHVKDRYDDCCELKAETVGDRVKSARQMVGYVQAAKALGSLQ